MDASNPRMSWPLPPTSPTQSFAHLQLQLKSLRNDIAKLTDRSEAAADRAAQVLDRLRHSNEAGAGTSDEPASTETETSITLRDHPYAKVSHHDIVQAHEWASTLDVRRSKKTTEPSRPLELDELEPSKKIIAQGALHSISCCVPEVARTPPHSTYEQSRAFLKVTMSVKDKKNRAAQCDVVEVSCPDGGLDLQTVGQR